MNPSQAAASRQPRSRHRRRPNESATAEEMKQKPGRPVAPSRPRSASVPRILVLHGNRQTGDLLLGRMSKLRSTLLRNHGIELVALDAPFLYEPDTSPSNGATHPDGTEPALNLRTWWHRADTISSNTYQGLEESIQLVRTTWCAAAVASPYVGLWGFSQGARLVHLLTTLHQRNDGFLPGLQCAVMVAGYSAPWPDNCPLPAASTESASLDSPTRIDIPSLHVWGTRDELVTPSQSHAVTLEYSSPEIEIHTGGHHVPMRAAHLQAYTAFVARHTSQRAAPLAEPNRIDVVPTQLASLPSASAESVVHAAETTVTTGDTTPAVMDDDIAEQQRDEVEAIQAIFPDEFQLVSACRITNDETMYDHPIVYTVRLDATEPPTTLSSWPPHALFVHVTYPPTYPTDGAPILRLQHDNHGMEFTSQQTAACLDAMQQAAAHAHGTPSVLVCLLAVRDYLDSTPVVPTVAWHPLEPAPEPKASTGNQVVSEPDTPSPSIPTASQDRIRQCHRQGLDIAATLLQTPGSTADDPGDHVSDAGSITTKGGSWLFSIGLVGKPSAGKSTFFNTATGFARQRQAAAATGTTHASNESDSHPTVQLGGAAMAPHPFTTIEPNTGYALVPAPVGSCPEDDLDSSTLPTVIGATHGRDHQGRRLLPVLLKDVAGLVPGAYQGRGRGNQFLNDLCDTDVLIHVCDASGTADAEGNVIGLDDQASPVSQSVGGPSHPLNDMAWIRDELIQWMVTNLLVKWDTICRKGRTKLAAMFSGYGQPEAVTIKVLCAVETYINQLEHREKALDSLERWDVADVHRLVSAFLGVRFPIALALNKMDLPSSASFIRDIQEALPIHGARVATPLSARQEMAFMRRYLELDILGHVSADGPSDHGTMVPPRATWDCLQSAIALCPPVLAFPVLDHTTYAPLPGLIHYATSDPSLPTSGMIAGLVAAGGVAPSEWDATSRQYARLKATAHKKKSTKDEALRDAILMKPGSTIHDLFLTLKRLGALSGEFVRAEAAGDIGSAAKPIPKHDLITRKTRIVKIMTNKRTAWQNG